MGVGVGVGVGVWVWVCVCDWGKEQEREAIQEFRNEQNMINTIINIMRNKQAVLPHSLTISI